MMMSLHSVTVVYICTRLDRRKCEEEDVANDGVAEVRGRHDSLHSRAQLIIFLQTEGWEIFKKALDAPVEASPR